MLTNWLPLKYKIKDLSIQCALEKKVTKDTWKNVKSFRLVSKMCINASKEWQILQNISVFFFKWVGEILQCSKRAKDYKQNLYHHHPMARNQDEIMNQGHKWTDSTEKNFNIQLTRTPDIKNFAYALQDMKAFCLLNTTKETCFKTWKSDICVYNLPAVCGEWGKDQSIQSHGKGKLVQCECDVVTKKGEIKTFLYIWVQDRSNLLVGWRLMGILIYLSEKKLRK